MSALSLALVAAGGAIGSVLRAGLVHWLPAGALPWGTMLVNVLGSVAIGALMARVALGGDARAYSFWVVGICGGFTTFSAFSWQTFEQLQRGAWGTAAAHAGLSVMICLAGTALGWRLAR